MLPKQKRIKKSLFPNVLKGGRSFVSGFITLKISPSDGNSSKFSFVAPKAVSKKAVNRNLLRRRGYSALKKMEKSIKPGFSCVFFFKKGAEKASFNDIYSEVKNLLEKARVL